jgi:YjbE family integral membrane protein
MTDLASQAFWVGLAEIIGVNIVLSGDNAVVIALAARGLPERQRKLAVVWGSGAAVVLRVLLTAFAVTLLALPWLKLVGAGLLLWIGVKLLIPEDGEGGVDAGAGLMAAIRTVLVADLVMSLDNVIAVAAAAKGSYVLLVLGLAISIPLVVFGTTLLLRVMQRFPVIVTVGGGLLGWVAGEMAISDPATTVWIETHALWLQWSAAAVGALVVVALGSWLGRRALARMEQRALDLALPPARTHTPEGTNS